ncbi:hypothetical protein BKA62DRAFT_27292 [Auriculariales sp. MPI-PUGE-AT-0066]|nr:hypothetical protein BKA62DRAFT_27292 [Auriculariales sp. MPI-PUGE-AT-0066]
MKVQSVLALLLAALPFSVHGLLRFPCSQLTVMRVDPLINPGGVGAHLHQVIGGSSFNFNMPANTTDLASSRCSSCSVVENKSNYWSPTLYFQSPKNGTFKRVKQKAAPLLSQNGGMTVYYIQVGTVKAFPKGFRMISGNPFLRAYQDSVDDSRSIRFRCINDTSDIFSPGPETTGMPTTNCAGGIRTQINFPTCWDGKNVDTANHKDHVKYAIGASFGNFGSGCPSTHPVQLPLLFLETYWDTNAFAGEWSPGNGKQPFVWSMGDPTGFGYHADYMMGWQGDSLDRAMSQCNNQDGSCSALTTRNIQDMNDCAMPPQVDEPIDQWMTALPGCNSVRAGPGTVTQESGCGAATTYVPTGSWLKNITGWQSIGCAREASGENAVTGGSRTTNGALTVESCLNQCANSGFKFAGLKAGNTCICGSGADTSRVSTNYACNTACAGNANDFCGADNRVAVYNGGTPVSVPSSSDTPTSTPTSSTTTTTTTGGGGGCSVAKWGQCGGQTYTGCTTCASGSTCQYSNAYYSQCL